MGSYPHLPAPHPTSCVGGAPPHDCKSILSSWLDISIYRQCKCAGMHGCMVVQTCVDARMQRVLFYKVTLQSLGAAFLILKRSSACLLKAFNFFQLPFIFDCLEKEPPKSSSL